LAHLIVSQQGLCYTRSGIETEVDQQLIAAYKGQTKPTDFVSKEEITRIENLSISVLNQLEEDYNKKYFRIMKPLIHVMM